MSLDANGGAVTTGAAITAITIKTDGAGGFSFTDQDGAAIGATAVAAMFTTTAASSTAGASLAFKTGGALATVAGFSGSANPSAAAAGITQVNTDNAPPQVANIDISTTAGANAAIESIDNALNSVNTIQASLGAAQNRFSSIAATQTAQSTNLSSAQSQITDANFEQETANLSKAQVLQQAGISVLAQANSLPQQVLKLLG